MNPKEIIKIIRSIKDILEDIMVVYERELERIKYYNAFIDSWNILYAQNVQDKDALIISIKEFNATLNNLIKNTPEEIRNSNLLRELIAKSDELWVTINQ